MRNKDMLIKALVFVLTPICILWELVAFIRSPEHRLPELSRQLMTVAALCWLIAVLLKQPNDDDWVY